MHSEASLSNTVLTIPYISGDGIGPEIWQGIPIPQCHIAPNIRPLCLCSARSILCRGTFSFEASGKDEYGDFP